MESIDQKINKVNLTVAFRIKAIVRKAKAVGKKLDNRTLDIFKTRLELKVCKEQEVDFAVFCGFVLEA